jgi:hypothetical protein
MSDDSTSCPRCKAQLGQPCMGMRRGRVHAGRHPFVFDSASLKVPNLGSTRAERRTSFPKSLLQPMNK